MSHQLTPVGTPRPLHIASGIDAGVLAGYLAAAQADAAQLAQPSATFGNQLQGLRRDYTHRKSYDFDPTAPAQAGQVFNTLLRLAKAHAPTLWSNDFGAWQAQHPQGLKYVVGGKFFEHADDRVRVLLKDGQRHWVRNRPERQIVGILYLNDDYEGGELYFPTILDDAGKQTTIKPKTGDFVLFGGDERYLHGVSEVTQGERFCVTLWYSPLPIAPAETPDDVAQRLYTTD